MTAWQQIHLLLLGIDAAASGERKRPIHDAGH